MTSNQVAYAQVQINDRLADETERHNKETERNQQQLTAIQDLAAQNTATYQREMTRLKERELQIIDDFNQGKLTNEVQYREMLNNIDEQKISVDKNYKEQSLILDSTRLELMDKQQQLDRDLAEVQRQIHQMEANLKFKSDQYKNMTDLGIQYLRSEADLYKTKISNPLATILGLLDESLGLKHSLDVMDLSNSLRSKVDDDISTFRKLVPEGRSIPLDSTALKEYTLENQNRSTSKKYFRGRPMD